MTSWQHTCRVIGGRKRLVLLVMCLLLISWNANLLNAGAMLLHIGSTLPRIAQRGTTVDVTIRGICIQDAQEVLFYRPGIRTISIEPLPNLDHPIGLAHGGRMVEQILCRFQISPDCELGEFPFRIRTRTELSSIGTFHVSPFHCVDENELTANSNDSIESAMLIQADTSIRAMMSSSSKADVDVYKIPVQAGDRLSVEVDSVRIADVHYGDSEFDLTMRILDANGRELAANDDNSIHLQDPMSSVRVDFSGYAFVEVRRSVFVASDRPYVVHIGHFARPRMAFPPGGPIGTSVDMSLLGDPLGAIAKSIQVPKITGAFDYYLDGPSALRLRASSAANYIEQPDSEFQIVPSLPVAVNGRLEHKGDVDRYRIPVKKGQRLQLRVFAASLGSPIDPVIRIRTNDSLGEFQKVELEMDDSPLAERDIFGTAFRAGGGLKDALDPSVIWEPKLDGEALVEIFSYSGNYGDSAFYRIEMESTHDSIHTLLQSTAFDWQECVRTSGLVVPQGNRYTFNLNLPSGQGNSYRGGLRIVAEGLPAGVRLLNATVPASVSNWPIQLECQGDAPACSKIVRIVALPIDDSINWESRAHQAVPFINHSGGDAWRTVRLNSFAMAVTEPAPFSIALESPGIALVRGGELSIPVRMDREKNFDQQIEFQCDWLPPGLSSQPATIVEPGQRSATFRIAADANAPTGRWPIFVNARTVRDDMDAYLGTGSIRVSSPAMEIVVSEPFVELASLVESIRRGETKQIVWRVENRSSFKGTATVHLLGLPKGVQATGSLPVLESSSSEVKFTVSATDDALLGQVRGLTCEVIIVVDGHQIRQRSGTGTLRIDPRLR